MQIAGAVADHGNAAPDRRFDEYRRRFYRRCFDES
jgi:hypothetical protein